MKKQAQLIEEEFNKMFGIKSLNDEYDYNVFSMLAMNIHDAMNMKQTILFRNFRSFLIM